MSSRLQTQTSISKLRFRRKRRTLPGASPGAITIAADSRQPVIRLYSFTAESADSVTLDKTDDIFRKIEALPGSTHWIEIRGFGDQEMINKLCDHFAIHRLEMEDVLNSYQRPKLEEQKDHLFLVSRMFKLNGDHVLHNEQVSIFLGANYVLTMQDNDLDLFEPVRNRLLAGKGQIRILGADYLAYALMDAIVDNYFPVLEKIGERLDALEDELFEKPDRRTLQHIQHIKRELIVFRRTIFAERDKINDVLRTDTGLVKDSTRIFLRDTYDHTIQVMDLVESYKEILASLMDIYLSTVSNRMNQIMKVLAVISTIFIPLTFIVGVYGMNFVSMDPVTGEMYPLNMPELHSPYGYVAVWIFMVAVVAFQLLVFYKRGWLRKS